MSEQPAPPQISWQAKVAVLALLVFAMAGATELFARHLMVKRYGPWIVETSDPEDDGTDPQLGWSAKPNQVEHDNYGKGLTFTFNGRGMRDTEEHTPAVPEGRYRVICVGDSFTYGAGLGDDQTYPEQLERFEPRVQAINMGMGGYGVDQSILWYERDGVGFEHQLVMMAFIDDDYRRMTVEAFQMSAPKPRFILQDDGTLELTNVPVRSWGAAGYWKDFPRATATYRLLHHAIDSRTVQANYDRVAVAERLFARVLERSRKDGRHAVLVHLPTLIELEERCPDGEGFCKKEGRAELVIALEAVAKKLDLPFIDGTPPFRSVQDAGPLKPYFLDDGHYSAKGAALLSEHLVKRLPEVVPDFPRPTETASVAAPPPE